MQLLVLQKIIRTHLLHADDLFVEPATVAAFENDEAVFLLIHQGFCFKDKFFQLHLRDFSLKYGVLDPIQIAAAEPEHFPDALFPNIINGDYIHGATSKF